jgi:hypothetical protein
MLFSGHYDPDMWPKIAKCDLPDWEWYQVESFSESLVEDVIVMALEQLKILIGVRDLNHKTEFLLVVKGHLLSQMLLNRMDFTLESILSEIQNNSLDKILDIVQRYITDTEKLTFHFGGIKPQE